MRAALARVTGVETQGAVKQRSFGDGVAVLRRGHRSVASISALAEAIRRGDADATVAALLTVPDGSITWLRDPLHEAGALRERAVAAYAPMIAAARAGDAAEALRALASFRLLCAHRHGPYGVAQWTDTVEDWLRAESQASSRARSPTRACRCSSPATTTSCACTTVTPASSSVATAWRWRRWR